MPGTLQLSELFGFRLLASPSPAAGSEQAPNRAAAAPDLSVISTKRGSGETPITLSSELNSISAKVGGSGETPEPGSPNLSAISAKVGNPSGETPAGAPRSALIAAAS